MSSLPLVEISENIKSYAMYVNTQQLCLVRRDYNGKQKNSFFFLRSSFKDVHQRQT